MMKRVLSTVALAVGALMSSAPAMAQTTTLKTLVLYDAPAGDQFANLGKAYAIMLRNLLGHFNTTVDLVPVDKYGTGTSQVRLANYDASFYLGGYYDNATVPAQFLADAAATSKTLVWFKYNLWKLTGMAGSTFAADHGFNHVGLRGLNAAPTAAAPNPGFYDTVVYNRTTSTGTTYTSELKKYYSYDPATGIVAADPDVGEVQVTDATKATTVATIKNGTAVLPYVVRGGTTAKNFWYFADMPFSYIGPRDRYLVLADLLHDILGVNTPEKHVGLVRLEDVSNISNLANTRTLSSYMRSQNIPFSVAMIPQYEDPLGTYNGGVRMSVPFASATNLKAILTDAINNGGKLVLHGFTHQYGGQATPWTNPWTGVSGDDYEFWLTGTNSPPPEDIASKDWAFNRIRAGFDALGTNSIYQQRVIAWETPHYQGSPTANQAAARWQALTSKPTYQRVVYYTSDPSSTAAPRLASTGADRDFAVGQFFPYVIQKDYYGQKVIPENLGNIEYDIRAIDPSSMYNYTSADLCENARIARNVVRNSYASFFFHPFWLENDLGLPANQGLNDFKATLACIKSLGFTFGDAGVQ